MQFSQIISQSQKSRIKLGSNSQEIMFVQLQLHFLKSQNNLRDIFFFEKFVHYAIISQISIVSKQHEKYSFQTTIIDNSHTKKQDEINLKLNVRKALIVSLDNLFCVFFLKMKFIFFYYVLSFKAHCQIEKISSQCYHNW